MPVEKPQKEQPKAQAAEKPRDLRAIVTELYGEDFEVLSRGERVAYIQNAHTGFKIDITTGERV